MENSHLVGNVRANKRFAIKEKYGRHSRNSRDAAIGWKMTYYFICTQIKFNAIEWFVAFSFVCCGCVYGDVDNDADWEIDESSHFKWILNKVSTAHNLLTVQRAMITQWIQYVECLLDVLFGCSLPPCVAFAAFILIYLQTHFNLLAVTTN